MSQPGPGKGAKGSPPAGRSPRPARLIDIADEVDSEDIPLFLARQTYRRRRLMDLARLLPAFGLGMVLFPLLWLGPGAAPRTATGVIYLFTAWALLVLAAGLIARRLAGPLPPSEPGGEGAAGAAGGAKGPEGRDVV